VTKRCGTRKKKKTKGIKIIDERSMRKADWGIVGGEGLGTKARSIYYPNLNKCDRGKKRHKRRGRGE